MIFKKKTTQPDQKRRIRPIRLRRKVTVCLWILLFSSLCFAIYKNFTAIDTHTVHEREVVQTKLVDTSQLESFVTSFARSYYAWEPTKQSIEQRKTKMGSYLAEDLLPLHADTVKSDIPTSSSVQSVLIWEVTELGSNEYKVLFEVNQLITKTQEGQPTPDQNGNPVQQEKPKTTKQTVQSFYSVTVHVGEDNGMVIVSSPTVSNIPPKATFQPSRQQQDGTVDGAVHDEIKEFLTSFFQLYPTADQKQLAYYVADNALPPLNRDYLFSDLSLLSFKKDDTMMADVTVKFLDQKTNAIQVSQYRLALHKDHNWQILAASS